MACPWGAAATGAWAVWARTEPAQPSADKVKIPKTTRDRPLTLITVPPLKDVASQGRPEMIGRSLTRCTPADPDLLTPSPRDRGMIQITRTAKITSKVHSTRLNAADSRPNLHTLRILITRAVLRRLVL